MCAKTPDTFSKSLKNSTSDIEWDQPTENLRFASKKPSLILNIRSEVEIFLLMNCKTID